MESSSASKPRLVPPRRFTPAGKVLRAFFSPSPPNFAAGIRRASGRRGKGQRYERDVQEALLSRYPDAYVPSLWIRFLREEANGSREWAWCQPDGILLDIRSSRLTIVEIKLKHTEQAWWQIRRLYEPVLRAIFGDGWKYQAVEICRWLDPQTSFPERTIFVPDISEVPEGAFGVHKLGIELERRGHTRSGYR